MSHEEKRGSLNQPIKSNIIDNDSAKMATGHGVIQGYNGIAVVDDKHQLIVWAEVFGDVNESGHLEEILEGVDETCRKSGIDKNIYRKVIVTADEYGGTGLRTYRRDEEIESVHLEEQVEGEFPMALVLHGS